MKPTDFLITQRDMQVINEKSDLDNCHFLDIGKRCAVFKKEFLKKDSENEKKWAFWTIF